MICSSFLGHIDANAASPLASDSQRSIIFDITTQHAGIYVDFGHVENGGGDVRRGDGVPILSIHEEVNVPRCGSADGRKAMNK
jgi:hypothetical protein